MLLQRVGLSEVPLSLHRPRRFAPAVDGCAAPPIPYAVSSQASSGATSRPLRIVAQEVRPTINVASFEKTGGQLKTRMVLVDNNPLRCKLAGE